MQVLANVVVIILQYMCVKSTYYTQMYTILCVNYISVKLAGGEEESLVCTIPGRHERNIAKHNCFED